MPASTDSISAALKSNFGSKFTPLDKSLQSGALAKRVLTPILYDDPIKVSASGVPQGTAVRVLNPGGPSDRPKKSPHNGETSSSKEGLSLPKPKTTFYRRESIMVGYKSNFSPGSGMVNVGNTCYLNSTLQALFHTPALVNYLLDGSHSNNCSSGSNGYSHACTICALSLTLKETHRNNVVRPSRVYEKLKSICKHLVHGRQEDAHEFLRYLIESLQRSFLISVRAPISALDNASKETTPFNQIFGGYMRQEVTCIRCKYVSTTFQHFMDLLLDIRSSSNVEDALNHYFRPEKLGGSDASDMYKCEKCKVKVPAQKRSLVERPPVVLCIQLKRFGLLGGKISKSVQLNRKLEFGKFVRGNRPLEYRLVSMITHVGPSPNCGHYTAIGEASNGQFYQFDDSHVRPVSVSQALNTASYVVIYEMTKISYSNWIRPPTTNGHSIVKSPPTKKLVPYDDDEEESLNNHEDKSSLKHRVSTDNSHSSSKIETKNGSTSLVPRPVVLKQNGVHHSSVSLDSMTPSSSGNWTISDLDRTSINSDNSTGSVGGGSWSILPNSKAKKDDEVSSTSSWNIKEEVSKKTTFSSVKETISNTLGKLFPKSKTIMPTPNISGASDGESPDSEDFRSRKRKKKRRWDGDSHNGGVLDEIGRRNGSSISSWDGSTRSFDDRTTNPEPNGYRRNSYDEELDRGRQRKIKKRSFSSNGNTSSYNNPFQETQNRRYEPYRNGRPNYRDYRRPPRYGDDKHRRYNGKGSHQRYSHHYRR